VCSKTRLAVGDPAEEIAKVANGEDFDLFVFGSKVPSVDR